MLPAALADAVALRLIAATWVPMSLHLAPVPPSPLLLALNVAWLLGLEDQPRPVVYSSVLLASRLLLKTFRRN